LFTWRRLKAQAHAKGEAKLVKLLPVTVTAAAEAATVSPVARKPIGRMEIVLSGGERIIVGADVDATALARVVRTLARR
jgi:transposase